LFSFYEGGIMKKQRNAKRVRGTIQAKKSRRILRERRLCLEPLEDRRLLAITLVTTGDWGTDANWDSNAEPTAADDAYIGNGLTAAVTQNGEVAQNVTVGHNQTTLPGAGTLNVTGGSLTTGTLMLADGHDGTLNMRGGTLAVDAITDGSATSTINLWGVTLGSGSTSITVDNFNVNPATATADLAYTRSGGTLTINNDLRLGGNPDSTTNRRGNVTQTRGAVSVGGNLSFGGAANTEGGTYHLQGGTLSVAGDIVEGAAGTPDESVDQAHVYVDVDAVTIPSAFVVGGDMYVQSFRLGQNAGTAGAWILPAGQKIVNTGTMFVGNNGTGTLNVNDPGATPAAPTISVANSLRLGAGEADANAGAGTLNFVQGVIDINGGGLYLGGQDAAANESNTAGTVVMGISGETEHTKAQWFTAGANFEVGRGGSGAFTQHSGTVTVENNNLILGQAATANGTYTINGGRLETVVGQIRVGNTGKGTFIQNGGQVTSQGVLDLGNVNNAASSGAYTMNGGSLTLNNNWYIGNLRRGVFDYNDGTINFGNVLYVGGTNSSSANAAPNANGTLNIGTATTSPSLSTGQFEVGRHAMGVVNQISGTVNVSGANNLVISQYSGGNATYNMQGGTLNLGSGSNGNLNFNAGTGLFHQTGGTVQFSGKNINLTNTASGNATYRLDGGILDLRNGDIIPGAGTAAFTFTGGTLKDVDEFKLPLTQDGGILQIGSDTATADTMTVTGNYVQYAGTLEITLTNATTRDLLSVNGTSTLKGNLAVLAGSGFTFGPGNSVVILTSTGGFAGADRFVGLPQGDSLFVNGVPLEISYTANSNRDVTLTYDATPVIDADELGIGVDNQIVVTRSGANVRVTVDGYLVLDAPLVNLTNLTIHGQTGDDTLTVDYSNGSPIPGGGLFLHGGDNVGGSGAGDRLEIVGGTFPTVAHTMTGGDAGHIALDGGSVISYTGLEPVDLTGSTITHLVLNLPAGADNAELSDLGGGTLRLESTDSPVTFEQTDFVVPSGSVTIHAGSDDRVTVATAVDMGSTDLVVVAGAIHLAGGTLTAGDHLYLGSVVLGEDAVLTGTNVTFRGTVDSDATARSLEIRASGQTRFANHVGSTSPLASLTTDAAGNTVFSTSPNGVFAQGLEVNLPFDETSDGITPDISGNGRNGSLVGNATVTSGMIGNAISLDGNGDWIRLDVLGASYDGVTGTEARTMAAWIRTTATDRGIMTWGTNAQSKKWVFRLDGGRLRIEVNGGFRVGTTVLNDGQWHHVALTLQGGSSPNVTDALLYVDGIAESTYTTQQSQAIDTASGTSVYIGADRVTTNNNSRDFSGQIDEVGIWSRALAAAEIAHLASAPALTVTTSGPTTLGNSVVAEVDVTLTAGGSGVRFDGKLDVNSRSITIVDPNTAVVADVSIDGGTLTADKGVSMSSGDVLTGVGTIVTASGKFAVNSGRIAPGVGAGGTGILVTGNVDFGTGTSAGTFAVDLNGTTAGTGHDQLDVNGTVDLSPAVLEVTLGFMPTSGNTFTIIATTGGATGTFRVDDGGTLKDLPEGAAFDVGGQTFTITYKGGSGDNVVLTARGVPETEVTLDGSGNLLISDINNASHDDLTIRSDVINNRFVIRDPNLVLTTNISAATRVDMHTIWVPFDVVSGDSVIVDTLGGNDTLTIDFSLGDFAKAIEYRGGEQTGSPGDVLVLTGGTYGAIVFNYENLNDGDIDISGQGISYTGLEPILSNLNTDTVTLNYGPAGETIVVSDAGGGRTRVTSTAGEVTAFNNPTASLTINAGDGDDTIIVASLAAGYASLTIDGQGSDAGDSVIIGSHLDLASLDITADNIVFGPVVSQPVGTTIFDFDILRDPDWTDASFPDMAGAVDSAHRGFEFQLDSTVSHVAAGASRLPGIDATYVFSGNTSGSPDSVRNKDGGQLALIGSGTTSPQSRVPAPDLSSASFEIWFKPDDLTDKKVLWETGGGTGTAFALDGNNLIFSVIQPGSGQLARVSYNLATDPQGVLGGRSATDEFIHAIGTFDMSNNGTSTLYINGFRTGSNTASSNITDWDGGDASGLATVGGSNMGGFGSNSQNFRPFNGQIAIFRIFGGVLDADQVVANYDAVAAPLTIHTTGDQTYRGASVLTGHTQVEGANVHFASSIDAIAQGVLTDLTVNTTGSGTTTFGGPVGANHPPGSLAANVDGNTVIEGGVIVSVGNQMYMGPVQITGHTQLDAANVTFGSTVDASAAEILPDLVVNTSGGGTTTFADAVGTIHPLASLTTNADGTTQLGSAAVTTTNLRLNYNAWQDAIPGDDQWPEAGTSGGRTWTLASPQSRVTVNDPKVAGITHAYQFPDARATTTSFYNVPSTGASSNNATFELWFKPGGGTGNQMLFETGGSTNGMAIYYDATNPSVVVQAQTAGNSNAFRATAPLAGGGTGFQQVVGVLKPLLGGSGSGRIEIYLNGQFVAAAERSGFSDWAGSDGSGLGQINGSSTLFSGGNFQGQIAILRYYNLALDASQIETNYRALTMQVVTSGDQSYGDSVVLASDTTLAADGVRFEGTVDSDVSATTPLALAVNAGGDTVFHGNIGDTRPLASVTTDAAGRVVLAANITTSGDQTYRETAGLVLEGNATLTGKNIAFSGPIDDDGIEATPSNLTVLVSDVASVFGPVGSSQPLESITTGGRGRTELSGGVIRVNGAGETRFGNGVLLMQDLTITADGSGAIRFAAPLDSRIGDNHSLVVDAPGDTVFGADVGSGLVPGAEPTGLGNLTTDAAGRTLFGTVLTATPLYAYDAARPGSTPNVWASTTITQDRNVTLSGVEWVDAVSQRPGLPKAFRYDGSDTGTVSTFNVLSGSPASTATVEIWAKPAVDSWTDVPSPSGQILFETGGTTGWGVYLYRGASGDPVLRFRTGNSPERTTVDFTLTDESLLDDFMQIVTVTDPAQPDANQMQLYVNGRLVGNGGRSGNWQAGGDGAGIGSGGGSLLGGSGNGFAHDGVTYGTHQGDIALVRLYAAQALAPDQIAASYQSVASVRITTTGDQVYGNAAELLANAAFTAGGNLQFSSTLDDDANAGIAALQADADGTVTFGGAVGGARPLSSVAIGATGQTAILGGGMTTTGAQTYQNPVVLDAAAPGNSTTITGTNVTFDQTVRSAQDGQQSLIVNASGTTTFGGVVGDNGQRLANLTTDAAGATEIHGSAVITTGDQTYLDPVTLDAASNTTTLTGVNVTFGQALRSAADGQDALAVAASGTTTFGGAVGDNGQRLASLTTDAAGATEIRGGAVITTGDQTYLDPVTLDAASNMTTLTGVNVTFGQTLRSAVDGENALAVDASGTTAFVGAVGDNRQRLAALTTNAAGATEIHGGAVTTTGDQSYSDPVVLAADALLTVGGNLRFDSTVDDDATPGNANLTAVVTGTTTLVGNVGSNVALTRLSLITGGPLVIGVDVTARNAVDITVTDQSTTGDDLTGESGATIRSLDDAVELRAGDDLTLESCSTILAATTITLRGDYAEHDDSDPGIGSTIRLLGTLKTDSTGAFSVRVFGGPQADVITVNPGGTHSADSMVIDGQGGDDTYHIHLGRLNGGADAVTIADSGTTSGDQAFVYATGGDDVLTVHNNDAVGTNPQTGGFVHLPERGIAEPAERVNYSASLNFLTVDGGVGNDLFHVQPSQTAVIAVEGGAPGFGPGAGDVPQVAGDTLDFDSYNNTFNIVCGTIHTNDDSAPPANGTGPFKPVHYRNIENMPLDPLGTSGPLRFDMNWTAAATQAGYTSVLPTTVYQPGVNTFGWNAPINGFERGSAGFTSEFTDLLRDGHWHSSPRTFTATVASGWYLVSVKSGDKSFARDQLRVTHGDTGQVLLDNASSPAGQIAGHSFVMLVTDGTLDLTFANLGGDPYWVVNGIEIRPGRILTFGSPAQGTQTSDGISQTTFAGYSASAGQLVTVLAELDATGDGVADGPVQVVTPDADADLVGVQIRANDAAGVPYGTDKPAGYFEYTLRHPSQPGTVYVKFDEASGDQKSCVAIKFEAPPAWQFDFNAPGSPTQTPAAAPGHPHGYLGVLPSDLASASAGYGWLSSPSSFDRGGLASPQYSDLLRDGAWGSAPRAFRVPLPAGTYEVTVTFGDASFARDRMNVTLLQGTSGDLSPVTDVATAAGQLVHRTFTATTNTSGELVLQFSDGGGDPYWTVAGLEVRAAAASVTVGTPGGTPAADAVSVLNYAVSQASVGSLYTVSATGGATLVDLNGVAIVDADPRYAGIQIVAPSTSFTLGVRSPSSAGNVTVALAEVNGASRGSATQAYGYAPLRRFDFNGAGVDTQLDAAGNFWNVRGSDVFDPAVGHGWNAAVSEFQRGTAGISEPLLAALYRDGHWQSATRTFQVGVDPNKTYDVRIHTGDRSFARDQLRITVEGVVAPQSPVATAANQFQAITVTVPANTVGVDGILDIEIANLGGDPYWVINGIEVAESTTNEPAGPGLPALPVPPPPSVSTATRFDFGTSSSPLAGDFTQVGATNAFNPDLGYGWTSAAPTFSRGGPNALLQDGHWGTDNTFLVNVNSGSYIVNVTVGDASFARNNIEVDVNGVVQIPT
jgi:hypothetical protein